MLRGLYTAASGMLLEGLKTESIANNLANADTHGFKRQSIVTRSFPEMLLYRINDPGTPVPLPIDPGVPIGRLGTGAALDALPLDMTAGALRFTGNRLDVALHGPGFLSVQLPSGEIAHTRHGALHVGADAMLVNQDGLPVLADDGPVVIDGTQVAIADDGVVWIDGAPAAQLALVEFDAPDALERMGHNLLLPTETSGDAQPAQETTVQSEHLEASNVNIVSEMVTLIASQRAYEANQKVIQVQDDTLGRLING